MNSNKYESMYKMFDTNAYKSVVFIIDVLDDKHFNRK